ncbi:MULTISPECIES: HAAS signaling domain-containing protein [Mammaliicoccus]|uniref:HAAS signaling domain-containing protein n=1 Tax=Mammaliicoccus TaxID=2803850 RepID=UPI000E08B728|nr:MULTISPECIES: DUF1700 domain-containing protein [Mammaliicoccus]RTX86982.1 DUF1700 domain-containing protein [Mammaliicoccus fleurettii]SUM37824.1 Predicted membrane protein [Mammaliicoccus fleurettii]HCN60042.1 hypothetical protein [Staphylococcus sp.]
MNKKSYLNTLNKYLKNVSVDERADILDEYETHFISGIKDGQSEDMIAKELGNPKEIAKEINATLALDRAETNNKVRNVWQAIISVMGLSILNFFVILIPIVIIISILFSFIVTTLSLLITPAILIVKGVYNGFDVIQPIDLYVVLTSFGLGLMIFTVTYLLTKWSYKLFVKYLRWNISIVKGSAKS